MTDLLDRILGADPPAFAMLYRPDSDAAMLDVLIGQTSELDSLSDIELCNGPDRLPESGRAERHETLVLLPYRQIRERGFAAPDDGEPLLAMSVTEQLLLGLDEVRSRLPNDRIELIDGHFDVADQQYAATVREIIDREIGGGLGANFVLKRTFTADITDYSIASALSFFNRLLSQESGAYWTFIVHTGSRTFVGATPERHISLRQGTAVMNPISGTYRYPGNGPVLAELVDFLGDRKEVDELYMVLDEELKMMARICDGGGRVTGPQLRQMARLAHTEYFIDGHSDRDLREVLRETMFAPTVTGSPIESACRVISRYEPDGRGYYSGVAALISRDRSGARSLDSAILIRTADVTAGGRLRIGVGATLVRHSDPISEVAETRAKVAGLLAALSGAPTPPLAEHPEVLAALARRNESISEFWCTGERSHPDPALTGRRALIIDAEDTFTAMLGHQLQSVGLSVTVAKYYESFELHEHDVVVLGPGPGDPGDEDDPRIARLREVVDVLLQDRQPFLAVCLSHQVLSRRLGLPLIRRASPNQGVQREIDLFGSVEHVGFYNTFAAHSLEDKVLSSEVGAMELACDPSTSEVYALKGAHFMGMQFHPESVLTRDGPRIVVTAIKEVLAV